MTQLGPTRTAPAASVVPTGALPSFIEWGPVFAGAVLAAAFSFVLLTGDWAVRNITLAQFRALRQTDRLPGDFLDHGPADSDVHGWGLRRWPVAIAVA